MKVTHSAVVTVICILVFGLSKSSFAQTTVVYVREDIQTFSKDATKVAKLRKAVETLQSKKMDDATSWLNMANIHGYPGSLPPGVPQTVTSLYAQCHRQEEMFFLWHRAYVWSMERLMQDALGDVTFRIPYWDWYKDPALPEIFRNEWSDSQHTKKNPLYIKDRKPKANGGQPIWTPKWVTDFGDDNFGRFQDNLNFSEHSTIHVAVGTPTNMGHPNTAARDPIFWLHHANIDRLLPVWKKLATQHTAETTYPDWKADTYRFPPPGWSAQNSATVTPSIDELSLNSTDKMMGYSYDRTDPPTATAPALPMQPPAIKNTAVQPPGGNMMMNERGEAMAIHRDIEIGEGGTVKLNVGSAGMNKLMRLAQPQDTSAPPTAITIVLSKVVLQKPDDNVLSYQVFLNLPVSKEHKERFHDHFLGSVSLFALAHQAESHDHGSAPNDLRFDATKALSNALKSVSKPEEVSVSVLPVLAPDSKAPKAAVIKIGEIRLETSTKSQ